LMAPIYPVGASFPNKKICSRCAKPHSAPDVLSNLKPEKFRPEQKYCLL
jgi:hypothetical protein